MALETSSSKIIPQPSWSPPGIDTFTYLSNHEKIDEVQRRHRQYVACDIDRCYTFGSVRQHIVRPSGCDTLQDEKYYGVSLVGVYGMNSSICVVTKPNELDLTRLHPNLSTRTNWFIGRIVEAFISKIEGLAFDGDRETKPFGFVSVVPVPVSSSEYDEKKAIDYLTSKMQRGLACNSDETIMTAICAFKHLCLKELKAEELLVTSWSPKRHGGVSQCLLFREIQNYLDIINPGSVRGGSDLRDYLDRLDSHIDSDVEDSDSDSDMAESDVEYVDADYCPIDHQEREKCLMVVCERMLECAKSKGLNPRRVLSLQFRIGGYAFENVTKTSISCCGIHSWPEVSHGLTWVAVHGMNSICMVVRHNDVDMKRVGPIFTGIPKYAVMSDLTGAVISDIEDFPDESREIYGQSIKVPFGVVSVNLGMNKVHEKNGHETIAFLGEKIRNGSVFTVDETIQTTICAFQHLCFEELKAEDIYVSSGEVGSLMPLRLSKGEIRRHLQVINRGSSSSSSSPSPSPAV